MKTWFRSISVILASGVLMAAPAQAGLLATDGAGTVATQHLELELNGSYANDTESSGGVTTKSHSTDADMTVTAGVADNLDVSLALPYTFSAGEKENDTQTSRAEGFNDMTVQLKYQFLEYDGLKVSLKPGLILPTGKEKEGLSDGRFGFTAWFVATKEFSEGKYALHANAGYERHNYKDDAVDTTSRSDIFAFSLAGEAEVAEGLKLQTEWGFSTNSDKTSNTPLVFVTAGGTYEITKILEVYAGVKFGLTSPEDDVTALYGLKVKF